MQTRLILFSLLALTVFVVAPTTTYAVVNPLGKLDTTVGSGAGADASYNSSTNIQSLVGTVISTFLSILGVIFLVLMVYGGFLWMTAQGAEEEVTKAKKLITQAVIGLAIVMGAYAISYFVTSALEKTTVTSTPTSGVDFQGTAGSGS